MNQNCIQALNKLSLTFSYKRMFYTLGQAPVGKTGLFCPSASKSVQPRGASDSARRTVHPSQRRRDRPPALRPHQGGLHVGQAGNQTVWIPTFTAGCQIHCEDVTTSDLILLSSFSCCVLFFFHHLLLLFLLFLLPPVLLTTPMFPWCRSPCRVTAAPATSSWRTRGNGATATSRP